MLLEASSWEPAEINLLLSSHTNESHFQINTAIGDDSAKDKNNRNDLTIPSDFLHAKELKLESAPNHVTLTSSRTYIIRMRAGTQPVAVYSIASLVDIGTTPSLINASLYT